MDPDLAGSIRLLCLDVDGVLTDGRIMLDSSGQEIKAFHVRDGLGIKLWQQAGHAVAIITSRSSPAVTHRAAELGIEHVFQGCRDKHQALEELLGRLGISHGETAAMGDDLPDLPVLSSVGLPIAVSDAAPEVREAAKWITSTPGGHGAVRECIEKLLQHQGHWENLLAHWQTVSQER